MATIIAGMFDTIDKAEGAVGQLLNAEFAEDDVCSFANNPPGQHATLSNEPKVSGAMASGSTSILCRRPLFFMPPRLRFRSRCLLRIDERGNQSCQTHQ